MPQSLLDKIIDKVRNIGSGFKGSAVATLVAFFTFNFFHVASCSAGPLACGSMNELGFIFPLFLLVITIFHHVSLTLPVYTLLYLISSAVYIAIAYYALDLIEKNYERFKNRPHITLKGI